MYQKLSFTAAVGKKVRRNPHHTGLLKRRKMFRWVHRQEVTWNRNLIPPPFSPVAVGFSLILPTGRCVHGVG